ncbi:NADPH-dependent 7-cyano-7-deazaguanine reductase QueF [Candidatus Pantoea carbekii]|uniref:NADPH-dependent 7-cyano-7-deazaguanine reductase n=1 Tax=Candidatus Pantoea carbekii TaxID=1235990 RepID=U3U7A0_9GAMM|nr:NADPH-dependent 7-cyano-7-deazaguanine reductase QueF [Candidatus Pantoea carbekii]AKC32405.1 NADPH-dependent 7-cyano-7-deazaguanine reductase [Candidatus Pantoea carbekii]BAO00129.1 NADPH-dependent 7-cyano-7-deazaguaninereductase [Candidatus Pantoea carbekii]
MTFKNQHKIINNLVLGKPTSYPIGYQDTLLQSLPRNLSRNVLNIQKNKLSFHGADIWTLYELSWLNKKGLPQVAIGQVIISADSQNFIESKSFKLYLNSFNQAIFADWDEVHHILQKDISNCAMGNVCIKLFKLSDLNDQKIGYFEGELLDEQDIIITDYNLNINYLACMNSNDKIVTETLISHLLKSNCMITNQPDWASIMIRYEGPRINRESLLSYLVSFRQHNEFHEQCIERIFSDLLRFCKPTALTVYARYTRRGGIDINPWRSNVTFLPNYLRLARQ